MKIIILLILSLIFITPATAQEKSDVGPNYSDQEIQKLIKTIREGIECRMANDSLQGDLTYYNAINSVLNVPTPEILTKISMISDDFELTAGMCGSVSGNVPTTVGQATLKVDEILVGGKSK